MAFLAEGEELIMEGLLHKKASGATGMMRLWRERTFVLTSKRLLYFEHKQSSKSAAPKGVMPLEDMRQVEDVAEKKTGKPFCICISTSASSWIVRADSQADSERWLCEIRSAIRQSGRAPLSATMPPSRVPPLVEGRSALETTTDSTMTSSTFSSSSHRHSQATTSSPHCSSAPSPNRSSCGLEDGPEGGEASGKKPAAKADPSAAKRPPLGPSNNSNNLNRSTALDGDGGEDRELSTFYSLGRLLGGGGNGEVREGVDRRTGERVAIKMVDSETSDECMFQKEIWQQVQHKNVVRLLDFFKSGKRLFYVMELAPGRDLFYGVMGLYDGDVPRGFSERDALGITSQIMTALRHLHLRRIVHCDLKPENILMHGGDGSGPLKIKLADWGFAQVLSPKQPLTRVLGTGSYMAPEMLAMRPYDEKVDMWSCGVILYVLLCGFPPYEACHDDSGSLDCEATLASIQEGCEDGRWASFPSPFWDKVSSEAKAFVRWLLTLDPARRPSAEASLKSDWHTSLSRIRPRTPASASEQSLSDLPLGLQDKMRQLNASRSQGVIEHCLGGALQHTRSGAAIAGAAVGGQGDGEEYMHILDEQGWQPLISLCWSSNDEDRRIGVAGLANASQNKKGKQRLVRDGGLRVLLHIGSSCESEDVLHSVAIALCNIAAAKENVEELLKADAHTCLLRISQRTSTVCRYQAARALAKMSLHAPAQSTLVEAGVLGPVIELAQQTMFEAMQADALAGLKELAKPKGLRQVVMAHIIAAASSEDPEASGNNSLRQLWESIQGGSAAHSRAGSAAGTSLASGGTSEEDSLVGADSLTSLTERGSAVRGARDGGGKGGGGLSLGDLRECTPKAIRSGSSSAVHKMVLVKEGAVVAVKFVALCLVQAERDQLLKEVSDSYSCGLPSSDPLRASHRSHVIGFYGAFYDAPSRRLGIVMDYVGGGNLEEVYKASAKMGGKGRLTDGCFASIMFQAVTALNFMHSHHLIHRDFKPSSLLIDTSGQVKLTNLGNLRKLAKTTGQAASVVGTTCYFAPERIIGVSFTNSADIWALGLTILEAHMGSYPFKAQQHNYIELLEHIVQSPCPVDAVKDTLARELQDVLRKCLEKQAKDRPSAQDLLKTEFVLRGRDSACGVELGKLELLHDEQFALIYIKRGDPEKAGKERTKEHQDGPSVTVCLPLVDDIRW